MMLFLSCSPATTDRALAFSAQKRIAAGEVSLAEQVSKVEEVVSKAFVALDDRNKERRKDVLLLESQLQDKMEARKGDHLETIRQKCLKRYVKHTCPGCVPARAPLEPLMGARLRGGSNEIISVAR